MTLNTINGVVVCVLSKTITTLNFAFSVTYYLEFCNAKLLVVYLIFANKGQISCLVIIIIRTWISFMEVRVNKVHVHKTYVAMSRRTMALGVELLHPLQGLDTIRVTNYH